MRSCIYWNMVSCVPRSLSFWNLPKCFAKITAKPRHSTHQEGEDRVSELLLFWFTGALSSVPGFKVKVAQLCPTLCHPMDYTVHGIPQARILEWVAIPFSRESSWSREDPTCCGAAKPMHPQLLSLFCSCQEPGLLKPTCPSACAPQREKPLQVRWEACAPQLEGSPESESVRHSVVSSSLRPHEL